MRFLFGWFVKITGFIPYLLTLRPKIYYENKKVQSRRIKGGAIVIGNHTSIVDFAATMFVFPFRTLRCVVAEVMFRRHFLLTLFLRMLGAVRVDRDAHDFSFLGKCNAILSRGGVVEIYPEARIPRKDESTPLPFKSSTAYLALESGARIIPIYNNGKYLKKERLRIIVGTPIDVRALYDSSLSEKENLHVINELLRGKIIALREELERRK